MTTPGARLRRLRTKKGLTQTEVTGGRYSKEYVSQVELGKTRPSPKAIRIFAKHLEVDESYFDTGVDLEGRERFESLMATGEAHLGRREPAEAARVFSEAVTIAQKAQNQELAWRAETGRAWALHHSGDSREAAGLLDRARRYYTERPIEGDQFVTVLFRLGCCREALGDLELAVVMLDMALEAAERAGGLADALRLRILRAQAALHTKRGDLEAGREAAESALTLARTLDDRHALADAYWEAARVEEHRRDFPRATEYALRARDLLGELDERRQGAQLLGQLGDITTRAGDPAKAIAYCEAGLAMLGEMDDPEVRSALLARLAEARLALGEGGLSLESATESLGLLEGRGGQVEMVLGDRHLLRARVLLALGRLGECRVEMEAAKRCFEPAGLERGLSRCLLVEGDLWLSEGSAEQAATAYRRSSELAQGMRW